MLDALGEDMRARIAEQGAAAYLQTLEDTLSNVVGVSGRQAVAVDSFTRAWKTLRPVRRKSRGGAVPSHLPLYTLRAAADT